MAEKRLKKNISFSPHEKDIYDFLGEQENASALIKSLVLRYMVETGYYKDLKDRTKKINSLQNNKPKKEVEKEIIELVEKIYKIMNENKL